MLLHARTCQLTVEVKAPKAGSRTEPAMKLQPKQRLASLMCAPPGLAAGTYSEEDDDRRPHAGFVNYGIQERWEKAKAQPFVLRTWKKP